MTALRSLARISDVVIISSACRRWTFCKCELDGMGMNRRTNSPNQDSQGMRLLSPIRMSSPGRCVRLDSGFFHTSRRSSRSSFYCPQTCFRIGIIRRITIQAPALAKDLRLGPRLRFCAPLHSEGGRKVFSFWFCGRNFQGCL